MLGSGGGMCSYFYYHSYLYGVFLLLGLEIKALDRCVGLSWMLELLSRLYIMYHTFYHSHLEKHF